MLQSAKEQIGALPTHFRSLYQGTLNSIHLPSSNIEWKSTLNDWTSFTDTKIKKVGLYALSCLTFVAAKTLTVGAIPLSAFACASAFPLYVASGFVAWYALTLIDYDSPQALIPVREKAQLLPLEDSVKVHGWDKLFAYEILPPDLFEVSYTAWANQLPFKGNIELFHKATRGLELIKKTDTPPKYSIPSPKLWIDQFRKETKGMPVLEIVQNYCIEDLIQFEVITEKQYAVLKEAGENLENRESLKSQYQEKLSDCIHKILLPAEKEFMAAKERYLILFGLYSRQSIEGPDKVIAHYLQYIDSLNPSAKEHLGPIITVLKDLQSNLNEDQAKYNQISQGLDAAMRAAESS